MRFLPLDSCDFFSEPPVPRMDPAPKIAYSRAEAAEMLSICVSSLDFLISSGRLKAIHKGRRVLIHISEIQRMAAKEIPRIRPVRLEQRRADRPDLQLALDQ